MIFDTDVLSMLGKTGRADLLGKLFPEASLMITFEVYNELLRAKEAGYDFVDDILKQGFRVIYLDQDLIQEYEEKKEALRNLHTGELTSILLCKKEGMSFATNDNRAKKFCEYNDVEWLDIVDILRLSLRWGSRGASKTPHEMRRYASPANMMPTPEKQLLMLYLRDGQRIYSIKTI